MRLRFLVRGASAALALSLLSFASAHSQAPPTAVYPQPWNQIGTTVSLSASTSSSNVALGGSTTGQSGIAVAVCNSGSNDAFVALGQSNAVTATSGGVRVPANNAGCVQLPANGATYLAGITLTSTTTLYIQVGQGTYLGAGGGGSGGGVQSVTGSGTIVCTPTVGAVLCTGSGSGGTPAGSTNALQYNAGAGSFGGLALVNNAVLSSNGSGVSSLSTTLPSQLLIPQINDAVTTLTLSGSTSNTLANAAFLGNVTTVNGAYSGAQPTAVYNHFINAYAVDGSSTGSLENTRVYTNFGGSNQVGGFLNFDTTLFINTAITGDLTNEFYQAGNVGAFATVNVGGTSGSPLGHLFGGATYARLESGATNWWSVNGWEHDLSIDSGASANLATGEQVVLLSTNAVAPTNGEVGYLLSAQSGATATVTCGFCITGYEGNNPFASSASLVALAPHGGSGSYPQATITNGIDLNLIATTGFAWRGPNATSTIDGSGNVTAPTYTPTGTTCSSGHTWLYEATNANHISLCANGNSLDWNSASALNATSGMILEANGLAELVLANSGAPTLESPSVAAASTAAQNVNITAGNATGTGSGSNGGSVVITAGSSTNGTAGGVTLVGIANAAGNEILCYDTTGGPVTYESAVSGCVPSDPALKMFGNDINPFVAMVKVGWYLHARVWLWKDISRFDDNAHVGFDASQVCAMDNRLCLWDARGTLNYDKWATMAYLAAALKGVVYSVLILFALFVAIIIDLHLRHRRANVRFKAIEARLA
jgi:hypothetical protein